MATPSVYFSRCECVFVGGKISIKKLEVFSYFAFSVLLKLKSKMATLKEWRSKYLLKPQAIVSVTANRQRQCLVATIDKDWPEFMKRLTLLLGEGNWLMST
ncbi:hypothetical protein [Photobacterium leiognathi]|uniref:hypothetical protein n=1 Tax=Photobacterium leiognathi TaxID=553611 RepID=UPI002982B796|nr:hypothetical protein [Photobacterium leiognathi]